MTFAKNAIYTLMRIALSMLTLGWLILGPEAKAKKETVEDCPNSESAVTMPAPVSVSELMNAIMELRLSTGPTAVEVHEDLSKQVAEIFDTTLVKTKMEQFYSLLYALSRNIPKEKGTKIDFEPHSVRKVLIAAAVFSDPSVPNRIQKVSISRHHFHEPRYTITFDQDQTTVNLNKGQGFFLFRNGLCQHAKSLIFEKNFSVTVKKNQKGHVLASEFKGVDLFGRFGNRGMIDVDINYVALKAVEFYKGTVNGKVTVYVSREEFEKNNHSPLLKFITSFVPDRTVQPIDW